MRKNFTFRTIINFIGYVALIIIALALVVVYILKPGKVTSAVTTVAELLAYAVVTLVSFSYAKSKRNMIFMAIWFVATVLLLVMYFLA